MHVLNFHFPQRNESRDPQRDDAVRQAKARVAAFIREIIRERKITQKKAAEIMGTSASTVSRINQSVLGSFTLERLLQFAKALGVTVGGKSDGEGVTVLLTRIDHAGKNVVIHLSL